ncbi:MAG TPA: trehalose-6-phosphate synthase [Acidimicrobiia bacterium]|nr:trehalose-6-phosphate synthase [Acidimicrobiia bacterium]
MLVISNRGPYRFEREPDGSFTPRPGAGGIASALTPLVQAVPEPITWVAAALTDDDRAAIGAGATAVEGMTLELLDIDAARGRLYYDVVSNATLWFLHHGLFDLPRRPRFDRYWRDAWAAFVEVNRRFADRAAAVAAEGDAVFVQDYQLCLAPGFLRAERPDLRIVHFSHTPFCGPNSIRVLPDDVSEAICASMASVRCGFHTARWAAAYEASVRTVLGPDASFAGAFASPLAPDAAALQSVADSDDARTAAAELDEIVGDRALLLRIDRIDPSKNVVRGFLAFDRLLEEHPEWCERVVFVAMLNASREGLAEYAAYRQEVAQAVERVNRRWATGGWQPVVLDERDDFARSIAGLGRYDVLLVNPLKDGLNLVAKEGPLLNRRDGVVCLSPEAGAYEELRPAVLRTHPYDLDQTAGALHRALAMPAPERAETAERLRSLAGARTARDWFDDLVRQAAPAGR